MRHLYTLFLLLFVSNSLRAANPSFDDLKYTMPTAPPFNARGNGIANDTAAITNSYVAASTTTRHMRIGAGTYLINSTWLVGNGPMVIEGDGPGTVLRIAAAIGITGTNVTFKNLTILSAVQTAVYSTNASLRDLTFDHVTFDWTSGVTSNYLAIDSSYTENLRVVNCRFFKGGIQVTRAYNTTVSDNYFDMQWKNDVNEPIHFSQFSRGFIDRNTILNSATDAIDMFSSGDLCSISDNRIIGVGDSTLAVGVNRNEAFITLKVELTDAAGGSGPTLGWTESTIVKGNVMRNFNPTSDNNRWYGIYAKYIDSRASPAWQETNASRNLIIADNIISGFWQTNANGFTTCYFAGIHFDGNGAAITGNLISDISNQADGSDASLTGGIELGFNLPGVGIKAAHSLIANNIYAGDGTGIIVYAADSCVFSGNIVRKDYANNRNPRYGINFFGPANWCSFIANSFRLTFLDPIAVQMINGSLSHCVFSANMTESLSAWLLDNTDHCSFSGNLFGAVTVGTAGTAASGNSFLGNQIRSISPSTPGVLTAHSQVGLKIIGNTFQYGDYPILITGISTNQSISHGGVITGNSSENSTSGAFVGFVNVDVPTQGTFYQKANLYNGALSDAADLIRELDYGTVANGGTIVLVASNKVSAAVIGGATANFTLPAPAAGAPSWAVRVTNVVDNIITLSSSVWDLRQFSTLTITNAAGSAGQLIFLRSTAQPGWDLSQGTVAPGSTGTADPLVPGDGTQNITGALTASGSLSAGASSSILWTGRSVMLSGADGIITMLNAAGTDFTGLNFGGTTASFPRLQRSGNSLLLRLADGSDYGPFAAGNITAVGALAGASISTSGALSANATTLGSLVVTNNTTLGDASGDTVQVTGTVHVLKSDSVGFDVLSGASGLWAAYGLGRTSVESFYGVVGANGNFVVGSLVGDAVLRLDDNTKKIHLSVGDSEVPEITIANASVTVNGTASVTGNTTLGDASGDTVTVNGIASSRAGTGSAFGKLGSNLKTDTTTTGNIGAGEDNLISYSVPASVLGTTGDYLEFDVWGSCAANANTKDIKVYYGSTVLIDGGAVVLNGVSWKAHGRIVRTGAATQTANCELTVGGTLLSAVNGTIALTTAPTETLSGAVTFKVTGTSAIAPADNDIVQSGMVIKWLPNN